MSRLPSVILSLAVPALPLNCFALVIPGQNGRANSSESSLSTWLTDNSAPDFNYWDNVVRVSDSSGIYMGAVGDYGWVLTAAHVTVLTTGVHSITVAGTSYVVRDSAQIGSQDMRLYRIGGEAGDPALPGLASVPLAASTPAIGTFMLDFGAGERVEGTSNSALTSDAELSGSPTRFEWTGAAGTIRWGTNLSVNAAPAYGAFLLPTPGSPTATVPYTPWNNTDSFVSIFDDPGVGNYLNATEAGVARGDSGGPVFTLVGGQWELSGINEYILATADAPSTTGFNDYSGYVNLATYRASLIATMVPEPSIAGLLGAAAAFGLRRRRN